MITLQALLDRARGEPPSDTRTLIPHREIFRGKIGEFWRSVITTFTMWVSDCTIARLSMVQTHLPLYTTYQHIFYSHFLSWWKWEWFQFGKLCYERHGCWWGEGRRKEGGLQKGVSKARVIWITTHICEIHYYTTVHCRRNIFTSGGN